MKYPRYTKEQRLRPKLSDGEIKAIRMGFKQGWTREALAEKFGVSRPAILYWTSDSAQKRVRDYAKTHISKNIKEIRKRGYRRKVALQGKEFLKFKAEHAGIKKEEILRRIKVHEERIKKLKKMLSPKKD